VYRSASLIRRWCQSAPRPARHPGARALHARLRTARPDRGALLLLALLAAVALGAHAAVPVLGHRLTLLDVAAGGTAVVMLAAGAARAAGNLRALARREPYPAA
jgi:hypothetical protein